MDLPSSSSSPSFDLAFNPHLLGGSGGGGGCSRAIDRHNPIITDEKRSIRTPPNSAHPTPFFTPKSSPLHQQKQTPKTSPISNATSNARRLIGLTKTADQRLQVHAFRKSAAKLSNSGTISGSEGACTASKASLNCINTPPESSRYLLGEGEDFVSGFVDMSTSDFNPILKLKPPSDQPKRSSPSASHEVTKTKSLDGSKSSAKPPLPPPPPPPLSSNHQEVVLRVSLHCRGCEGKVRKHISRMQGVTSFSIDFGAKKVTVAGDITPLQVITSISKVKNTKLLSTTATSTDDFHNHGSS